MAGFPFMPIATGSSVSPTDFSPYFQGQQLRQRQQEMELERAMALLDAEVGQQQFEATRQDNMQRFERGLEFEREQGAIRAAEANKARAFEREENDKQRQQAGIFAEAEARRREQSQLNEQNFIRERDAAKAGAAKAEEDAAIMEAAETDQSGQSYVKFHKERPEQLKKSLLGSGRQRAQLYTQWDAARKRYGATHPATLALRQQLEGVDATRRATLSDSERATPVSDEAALDAAEQSMLADADKIADPAARAKRVLSIQAWRKKQADAIKGKKRDEMVQTAAEDELATSKSKRKIAEDAEARKTREGENRGKLAALKARAIIVQKKYEAATERVAVAEASGEPNAKAEADLREAETELEKVLTQIGELEG